ncbi:MAG TPA: hypothetical protein VGG12_01455, partial [Methylovirgula sp.]
MPAKSSFFAPLRLAFAAAVLGLSASSLFAASIELPKSSPFPESVTSTPDGTLFASSISDGGVVRIKPGAPPEIFIKPGAFGTRSTFGVHADAKAGLLWVCSNDA